MSYSVVTGVLAADVANSGTVALSYPNNKTGGNFSQAVLHKLTIGNNQSLSFPKDFSLSFGATQVTVTNQSASTWPAGTAFRLQLDEMGEREYADPVSKQLIKGAIKSAVDLITLGSPAAGSATLLAASQSVGLGAAFVLAATSFDVPRNVVAAWTNAAIVTVTGTDVYGKTMTEVSASGTSFTGKKAFKTITSITSNAAITGATAGSGNVLGLPVFLPAVGLVLKELQDGAVATAGTVVAGIKTAGGSTNSTGDVRGTYTPNATPDGVKTFQLVAALPDPTFIGIDQA